MIYTAIVSVVLAVGSITSCQPPTPQTDTPLCGEEPCVPPPMCGEEPCGDTTSTTVPMCGEEPCAPPPSMCGEEPCVGGEG